MISPGAGVSPSVAQSVGPNRDRVRDAKNSFMLSESEKTTPLVFSRYCTSSRVEFSRVYSSQASYLIRSRFAALLLSCIYQKSSFFSPSNSRLPNSHEMNDTRACLDLNHPAVKTSTILPILAAFKIRSSSFNISRNRTLKAVARG